jgi:hypothetical protein
MTGWEIFGSRIVVVVLRASPKGCEKIDAKTMYWGLC